MNSNTNEQSIHLMACQKLQGSKEWNVIKKRHLLTGCSESARFVSIFIDHFDSARFAANKNGKDNWLNVQEEAENMICK